MDRWSSRLIAALLCLAFPFAWNACFPAHEEQPVALTLGPAGALRGAELPGDPLEALLLESRTTGNAARLEFEFPWDRAGRYTLVGISRFDDVAPLELQVNGRAVSSMAFFRRSATDFERRRLATGVALRSGRNRIVLDGMWTRSRPYALLLHREAPLGALRFAGLAGLAALSLALRSAAVRRIGLSPGTRLAASLGTALLLLAAPLLYAALVDGRAIADLDQADRRKRVLLADFERTLTGDAYTAARGEKLRVVVLGDSTHFWPHPPDERMLPTLRAALAGEPVELVGIAGGAFSAYDYYLLLNRLLRDPPDLVVIPVNLRSFSPRWLHLRDHDFPRIERYLRLDELWNAHGLLVGEREIRWDALLWVHLDGMLSDGDLGAFLRGAGRYLHAERDRVLDGLAERAGFALPPALRLRARQRQWRVDDAAGWPGRVRADHEMLAPFRLIDRLALRHRVPILYYTVQANEEAQAALGRQIHLRGNYARIGREIGQSPIVTWLDLSGDNPSWMFADDSEHLTRRGMQRVAERLAAAIRKRSRLPRRGR